MHCLTEGDWTTRYRGVMDVLEEAKQKGVIRAHGCSCHSIEALRAAAKSPWVEVDLARVNPIGSHMDADPDTVVSVLREMRAAGKAVVGMKILGQGDLRDRQDEAIKYALSTAFSTPLLSAPKAKQNKTTWCAASAPQLNEKFECHSRPDARIRASWSSLETN